jgi:transcription initiation factor IIE alpha subunit
MGSKRDKSIKKVYQMEVEQMNGFCPICCDTVDIIIDEDVKELIGVCSECGNMLFYSNKLRDQQTYILNFK